MKSSTVVLFFSFLLVAGGVVSSGFAQQRQQLKQQAETELGKMTSEEIDRKIKELGMTRSEAAQKASELGISLEQYLSATKSSSKPSEPKQTPEERIESGRDSVLVAPIGSPRPVRSDPEGAFGLRYFGYDIFSEVPEAFEPTAAGPVDPEYLIGPGDVLKISVWGQVEFQNELTVDREGRVFIQTLGQVLVSGLTLQHAYESLRKQLSKSYAGLVSQPPSVWLDVTMGRLRPKRVFIMGEVDRPGGYTVSSYANVFNSLYSVGGPSVRGSLRDIRVIRGNKVIANVDLYDYLTGAQQTNDIRIQNNDIIFVPIRGKTISIRGEIRKPAIYELKENENILALLKFCGGVQPTAFDGNAQIDRIKPVGKRTSDVADRLVVDVNLQEVLLQERDVALFDADEVQVFPVLDEKKNFVQITGSVWRPGRYELARVRTVRELIEAAKGIQPKTYLGLAHLVRLNPDLLTRTIISFDLGALLESSNADYPLSSRDEVIIYSTEITEVKEKYVTIRGSVKNPGRYLYRVNMSLRDLIPLAGGYSEDAELLEAEIARVEARGFSKDSLAIILHPPVPAEFSVEGQTLHGAGRRSDDFLLQHRDEVLIRPNPNFVTHMNVTIAGDVEYPGVYAIQRRGERLSELLARSGGPTTTSYMGGAQFFRKGERLLLDFKKAIEERNRLHDVIMLGEDSVFVPSRPHTVHVKGEVNNPGLLSFIEGDDVMDYIARAGGLTDSSNYAVLQKPSGESRRVDLGWLSGNPVVPEGSVISVLRVPPPPADAPPIDIAGTVKEIFAILTSAATVAFIIWQVSR